MSQMQADGFRRAPPAGVRALSAQSTTSGAYAQDEEKMPLVSCSSINVLCIACHLPGRLV